MYDKNDKPIDLSPSYNYYKDQLSRVQVGKTEYYPTFKIFANGNGDDTKHISLHSVSAKALVEWLTENFNL